MWGKNTNAECPCQDLALINNINITCEILELILTVTQTHAEVLELKL